MENNSYLKKMQKQVKKINEIAKEMETLSDEALKHKTDEFKTRLANGETVDSLLNEAFAVVREASSRVLKMKHYDVQLIGGMVLHEGKIAEMRTGEGKTLVATLPAYLNALTGNGVHVVTVNDYLAERDHNLMAPLFTFLGLTSAFIVGSLSTEDKREAYQSDVVYITNTEIGFDYLRDNMVYSMGEKSQRGLPFCIVDEVDSVLLDDARTPLIISGQGDDPSKWYHLADLFARTLVKDKDFDVDEEQRSVFLLEEGMNKAEKMFRLENYPDFTNNKVHFFVNKALNAHYMMRRDKDYIVHQGEIKIIDESTGRISEGRRFSNGLHQALESKEGVKIQKESRTLATITYQNFFLLYDKLSGMTGTAKTNETEFKDIYQLDVIQIPTKEPIQRNDLQDLLYVSAEAKNNAIIKDIKASYEKGQPVLVGTSSVEKSETLAEMLEAEAIPHVVLNAKNHKKEAKIIENAGQKNAVTIATNMAGRGTDIKLGEGVVELGGLKVIGTERASNRRIDNQLIGRSGRQGDPGESQFYLSFDDDLLRVFTADNIKKRIELLAKDDNEPIELKMLIKSIHSAQARIDGSQYEARKQTIEFDNVNNEQRVVVYKQRNQLLDETTDIAEELAELTLAQLKETLEMHLQALEFAPEESVEQEQAIQSLQTFLTSINMGTIPFGEEVTKKQKQVILEHLESLVQTKKEALSSNKELERGLRLTFIQTVDEVWVNQIERLEDLKDAVRFAGFKETKPVDEYNKEAYIAFNEAMESIRMTMATQFMLVSTSQEETPVA